MTENNRSSAKKGAVVLLSGGLDSTTTLYIALERGFQIHSLSFDYGQRHRRELESAERVSKVAGCVAHTLIRLDPALFLNTALVGGEIEVPRDRKSELARAGEEPRDSEIPVTYVPARNILFLSHALALAESRDFRDIYIGVNAVDYSGYPDCRPEFIEAFEKMAALGMKSGVSGRPVQIHAPLIRMTKAEIVREGLRLGADYSLTFSCYDPKPDGSPCGHCDSCILRAAGFREAGAADPLLTK